MHPMFLMCERTWESETETMCSLTSTIFGERLNLRDLNNNNNPEGISEKSGNDL